MKTIYMQLVTTSHDQQLIPTTRTQTFYNNKYLFLLEYQILANAGHNINEEI